MLATSAADLLQHLLAEREIIASSYRDVFRKAADARLIDRDLAARLEDAAAMRNVLVHMVDAIDIEILHQSIPKALRDFELLVSELARFAEPSTDS